MKIGIPTEIKNHEYRVGATPAMCRMLSEAGHELVIQSNAGEAICYSDEMYKNAGARIVSSAEEVYQAEMIIKVKEPQPEEFSLIKEGQIIFGFLHLSPDPVQTKNLLERKCVGIAYETVTDRHGKLPLLIPMSEIAGRISIQAGANALQMNNGGKGLLLGGVPSVVPARVIILGGGVAGTEAARMAMGLGADVTVIDRNLDRLRQLDHHFGPRLKTLYSTAASIEDSVSTADLVIGSVLVPGKLAPKLVTHEMLKRMDHGSVVVDIAIDQGGCFESSRPTTHADPSYLVDGVIHYCVTNMPGACARTSTMALTNATMDYALEIANKGWRQALLDNPGLRDGLNVCKGLVTHQHVATDLHYDYTPAEELL